MYDHTLHCGRKHFCGYCLQALSTEKILKPHIKNCFKINGKQRIILSKKGEYVKFKIQERKTKLPFIIYADFRSILVPEDNGNHNPKNSYTNKYQNHIGCSYGYKLVCVDDKFSKPFKLCLGKDTVYIFINVIIEESRNCCEMMKNILAKNL